MTKAKSAKLLAIRNKRLATSTTSNVIEPVVQPPLVKLAGKYNDEPFWDDFLAAIGEYREEVNRLESAG